MVFMSVAAATADLVVNLSSPIGGPIALGAASGVLHALNASNPPDARLNRF